MKRIVCNDRERVGAWVAAMVGRQSPWVTDAAIGLERDGELIAGVVIDGYVPGARASMHCAGVGRNWLNREFLFSCFDYAFNQLDLRALINIVSAGNEHSIRFTKHIGFSELSRVKGAWDGSDDLVLFSMCRHECRWLEIAK